MKIALLQTNPAWEAKQLNMNAVCKKINELNSDTNLVILPEMFSTGFSMNAPLLCEYPNGDTLKTLLYIAQKKQLAIVGSWIVKEENLFYNRLHFVFPDGHFETYDKCNLFTLAKENEVYAKGTQQTIVEYLDWKICLQICYDLRFPESSRIKNRNYDLLVYVASWPERRIYAWDTLLKARAIENMSYAVGVNRCGYDINNVYHSGHSQVVDYFGNVVVKVVDKEDVVYAELDKDKLVKDRNKFNFV